MTGRLLACAVIVALFDPRVSLAQAPPRRGRGIGAIAGRLMQPPPQVRSCTEARSAVGADLSFAPPTRIGFDDIGQVDLTNQYAGRGVTFNAPVVLDMSRTTGMASFAHSPTHGIQQCYGKEFCKEPIEIRFAEPQARVQLWVGYAGRADIANAIWLEILDATGASIDRCGVIITPANTPQPIAVPLELTTATNTIAMARVAAPDLGIAGVAVDDIEFQRLASAPDLELRSARGDVPRGGRARIRIVVVVRDAPSPATALTVESPSWGTLSATVRALDPQEEGESIEVPLPADLSSGHYEYVVRLASPPGVAESRLDNNVLTGEIDVLATSTAPSAGTRPANDAQVNDRSTTRTRTGRGFNVVLLLIAGVIALAALGFMVGRTRSSRERTRTPKQEPPRQPPADRIRVYSTGDTGKQRIRPAHSRPTFVVRIRPVSGPSSIHVKPASARD